jgi:hypothetical protein
MPLLGGELAALDPVIAGVQTTREPGDSPHKMPYTSATGTDG